MVFFCGTFLRQLLTVLTVMLSVPSLGRFVIKDKHVRVSTKQVGSDCAVEGRATFEGLWRRQPACVGEDGNVEPRNDLETVPEA
jgi:hypothetical protein